MSNDSGDSIVEHFPRIESIEDEGVRESVLTMWKQTLRDTGITLETFPWSLQVQAKLGVDDLCLRDHINTVTELSKVCAEQLNEGVNAGIDLDTVIGGALVHNISKPYEFTEDVIGPIDELLGHPYFGLYLAQKANLPIEIQHIILSHTDQSAVEPKTLEAKVVSKADGMAADAVRYTARQ